MKIKAKNKISVRGDVTIIQRDAETGKLISLLEKRNVITYGGTDTLVYLLAPNAVLGVNIQLERQLKSIRWGISNTPADRSNTNLFSEALVGAVPVRTELFDANRIIGVSGTVEFTSLLGAGAGNGNTYREIGLFTRGTLDDPQTTVGAVMVARQTINDQVKTAAITLEARWRLSFTT